MMHPALQERATQEGPYFANFVAIKSSPRELYQSGYLASPVIQRKTKSRLFFFKFDFWVFRLVL